jgi:hypothetical protein
MIKNYGRWAFISLPCHGNKFQPRSWTGTKCSPVNSRLVGQKMIAGEVPVKENMIICKVCGARNACEAHKVSACYSCGTNLFSFESTHHNLNLFKDVSDYTFAELLVYMYLCLCALPGCTTLFAYLFLRNNFWKKVTTLYMFSGFTFVVFSGIILFIFNYSDKRLKSLIMKGLVAGVLLPFIVYYLTTRYR